MKSRERVDLRFQSQALSEGDLCGVDISRQQQSAREVEMNPIQPRIRRAGSPQKFHPLIGVTEYEVGEP